MNGKVTNIAAQKDLIVGLVHHGHVLNWLDVFFTCNHIAQEACSLIPRVVFTFALVWCVQNDVRATFCVQFDGLTPELLHGLWGLSKAPTAVVQALGLTGGSHGVVRDLLCEEAES